MKLQTVYFFFQNFCQTVSPIINKPKPKEKTPPPPANETNDSNTQQESNPPPEQPQQPSDQMDVE